MVYNLTKLNGHMPSLLTVRHALNKSDSFYMSSLEHLDEFILSTFAGKEL